MNERSAWVPAGPSGSGARPVGDAPVAPLVAAAERLARRWLVAVIDAAPLRDAERVPVAELARLGPALCAAMVRALAGDGDLARLLPGGELGGLVGDAGRLAGARDPVEAVAAVDALRGVIWSALLTELREPDAQLVAQLAARLGRVCAVVTQGAVAAFAPPSGVEPDADEVGIVVGGEDADEVEPYDGPAEPTVREQPWIVASRGPGSKAASGDTGPSALEDGDVAPTAVAPTDVAPTAARAVAAEGPAAWISSIGRRLERFDEDRRPFAVLLVEIVDLHRLGAAATPEALTELIGAVEEGLSETLRPADVLTHEGPGRYWLVTPDTDSRAALALAERLAAAVSASAAHRGTPLGVVIGTAVCPDDGREPAALAAAADVRLYAARAAGVSVTPPG